MPPPHTRVHEALGLARKQSTGESPPECPKSDSDKFALEIRPLVFYSSAPVKDEQSPGMGSLRWQALVVEDDDDTRASVAGTLFDYGLGVREARHGADALALLGEG